MILYLIYLYEIINEFIHPENSYSKEKDKVLESIHEIMDNQKNYLFLGTVLTNDERMISFRGRNQFIVYEN